MGQKALQPLLHHTHFVGVRRGRKTEMLEKLKLEDMRRR